MARLADRIRTSSLVILAGLAGATATVFLDLSDRFVKLSDRLGWTESEALTLARENEKSRFSDQLIRNAWKRLYLADRFARRALDGAPGSEMAKAWNDYLQSLLEWNTDLMVNIVGLETYYDAKKSFAFETDVQQHMTEVDGTVRAVYLSAPVQKAMYGKDIASADASSPVSDVFNATEAAREASTCL